VDADASVCRRSREQSRLPGIFGVRCVEQASHLGALLVVETALEQRPENRRVDRLPVEPRRRHQIADRSNAERQNVVVVE